MEKTIINLAKAYVGECQARNRYTFYSKIAKKEGYEQIADIFLQTAEQEKEHAKWLFRLINNLKKEGNSDVFEELKIEAEVPIIYKDTISNLKAAASGEHYENITMYPEFAKIADEEGLSDIAKRLRSIAIAEKHHEQRYLKLLKEVENNSVFKKADKIYWVCRKCGYVCEGLEPVEECPSCNHPKNYFERQCEEY